MSVEIDTNSGFCFGVRRAIATLEKGLSQGEELYCVGDIVHNEREIERLTQRGLRVIDSAELGLLERGSSVLFRAHGEPPKSYAAVRQNGLRLTDATCPVVLQLQRRIREAYERMRECDGKIIIFGKKGHAEVIGLMGQTGGDCVLIENLSQAEALEIDRPVEIFSQTTKNPQLYRQIVDTLRSRTKHDVRAHDTVCKQMSARADHLPRFAASHETIVFVGGAKSSNSKALFDICCSINPDSHFVTSESEVHQEWVGGEGNDVGITGATSTPLWLMQRVKETIDDMQKKWKQ